MIHLPYFELTKIQRSPTRQGNEVVTFGLMIDTNPARSADLGQRAQRAEQMGFDMVTVHPDHPSASGRHGADPSIEAWSAITWMAAHTTSIKVAPAVLAVPYRSPAVVAKMADSLHRLSGGRLILALGAGGDDRAIAAFGSPVRSRAEKVRLLSEALDVILALRAGQPFNHDGEFYRYTEATINPAAAETPIWLGVHGPRMAQLVAGKADGWLPSYFGLDPGELVARIAAIREAAKSFGRNPAEITCGYNVPVRVGPRETTTERYVGGTLEELAAFVCELVRGGVDHVNFWPAHGDNEHDQVALLAHEVIPRVRSRLDPAGR